MKIKITAFLVGFLFAIGLAISGMTQPQKVIGFLDVFGHWDPSLMFVMMGAIGVHFWAYRLYFKKHEPIFEKKWHLSTHHDVTPALIIGSILFGLGWGLGGYCPGPAITSLATFEMKPFVFIISMLIGMLLLKGVNKLFKV